MNFQTKIWKIGKHLTIKLTPKRFNLSSMLELLVWITIISLIVWWLV